MKLAEKLPSLSAKATKADHYRQLYEQNAGVLDDRIKSGTDLQAEMEKQRNVAMKKWEYGTTWADVKNPKKASEKNHAFAKYAKVPQRAEEVGLAQRYDQCYWWANQFLHSNIVSLNTSLKLDPKGHRIAASPTEPLGSLWLEQAIVMCLDVIDSAFTFYDRALAALKPERQNLFDELHAAITSSSRPTFFGKSR